VTRAAAEARRTSAVPWTLTAAILLTALNLRTAVTSVGPVLVELTDALQLGGAATGALTTMPVACFAVVGWYAPALGHRFGEHRAVTAGLGLMTLGLASRALVDSGALLLLLSVVALVGGALSNVLLPSLVKRHYPDRIGAMTAAYTTALAVGATAGAGLTVPLAQVLGGSLGEGSWRVGLGAWAVVSAVAVLPWLLHLRERGTTGAPSGGRGGGRMVRSRTAWALAVLFGAQSMQAYISLGWFAQFHREEGGFTAAQAGLLVAFLSGLSIPVSVVVPTLAARLRSQSPIVAGMTACYAVAYTGMLLSPRTGAWLWAFLVGIGAGAFPLSLTLIALRTRTADATSSLSAFMQSVGYVLAGGGPFLVGVLHGRSGSWTGPLVLLLGALPVMLVAGWIAGRPVFVEDELAASRAAGPPAGAPPRPGPPAPA
jgi:CP family cyanate transporter-like MFS transporter